ncbi:MAG: SMI1/KNR4 family protein [Acidimicrobiales bacterium]|nr:SMI1/KNR4 family protein [Acidimicrobiales bacterium]
MGDDYDRLCQLVRSRADEIGTGCTPSELDAVRGAFGVLPVDYVAYLGDFGWFTVSSHEVIGFGAGVPAHLDVIRVVTWERELAHPPMSAWLLPLENNGGGDHYCLDLAAQGSPVVFWSHDDPLGPDQVPAVVAPSFAVWAVAILPGHDP